MQKVVLILGMHRTGTSAVAGALAQMGIEFGEDFIPSNRHNPKGYFEHPEVVALHDSLLQALGSRWDDYLALPSGWEENDITREIRSSLIAILKRDFGEASLFGVKDPRLCRLMPLWFPIFESLPAEPLFVLTVRHPWEVAESLARRDCLKRSKSFLLWLDHTLLAERVTRGYNRVFVAFDELLDTPGVVVTRLQRDLALHPLGRVEVSSQSSLEPSLRHHRLREAQEKEVPSLVLQVYDTIKKDDNSPQFATRLDGLMQHFVYSREVFSSHLEALEGELANFDKRIGEIEQAIDAAGTTVRLEVFHPVAEGYRGSEFQDHYFISGSWQRLTMDLPAGKEKSDWPFRIDPVTCPAVIEIAEITLKDPGNNEILWSAIAQKEFTACKILGTAARLPHDKHLRILSFGGDPQLLLPSSTAGLNTKSLRLEIFLLVNRGANTIRECLAALNGTTPT
jgi:hypothetical protein